MKISVMLLSALISFSAIAQNPKIKEEKPKSKTTTDKSKTTNKAKKDSLKTSSKNKKAISPGYCPPCGMG